MLFNHRVLLFISLLGGAALAHAADPLTLNAKEVRSLFTGNTLYAETRLRRFDNEDVRTFQIYLRKDGTLTIRNFDGNTDTGWWKVTDEGLFCNQYSHTRRGQEKCFEVQIYGDHYRLWDVEADRPTSEFTIKSCNPEGL